jgi:hypothetical protein
VENDDEEEEGEVRLTLTVVVAAVIKRQVIKLTLCGQSATSYFVFLRQN